MKKIFVASLTGLAVFVSGCVSSAKPTSVALPPVIAGTVAPLTAPTAMSDLLATLIPHGQPISEWNGIPIMSSALAGEGDTEAYRFTTAASREQIEGFYNQELLKLGWERLGSSEGDAGAVIMIFSKDDSNVSISIFPKDDVFIVMIAG